MKAYPLHAPDFLDPRWVNSFPQSAEAIVLDGGIVEVNGVRLSPREPHNLPIGTAVVVFMNHIFYMVTKEDLEQQQRQTKAAERQREESIRLSRSRARREAEEFNATIKLPVKWDVGIKDVLSGLTQNSMGNGRNRVTVEHVLLLEPLRIGRLRRNANDFLCASGGNNGKRWTGQPVDRFHDGEGKDYQPKVTCKACLRLVERFRHV